MKKAVINTIVKLGQSKNLDRIYWQKRATDYLISSGHWLIVIEHQDLPVELAFIKELPQGKMQGGRIESTQDTFDMNKVIPTEEDLKTELVKSRHLVELERNKGNARIFLGDEFNMAIDDKYVDLLNGISEVTPNYTYKAKDAVSPVVFYRNGVMAGLIMPMRLDERLMDPFNKTANQLKEVA